MKFAELLGFTGIMVTNLFAYRTKNPKELRKTALDSQLPWLIEGEEEEGVQVNDDFLTMEAKSCRVTIAGWGTNGTFLGRNEVVKKMMKDNGVTLSALSLTKDGHPGHPLYPPYDLHTELKTLT